MSRRDRIARRARWRKALMLKVQATDPVEVHAAIEAIAGDDDFADRVQEAVGAKVGSITMILTVLQLIAIIAANWDTIKPLLIELWKVFQVEQTAKEGGS